MKSSPLGALAFVLLSTTTGCFVDPPVDPVDPPPVAPAPPPASAWACGPHRTSPAALGHFDGQPAAVAQDDAYVFVAARGGLFRFAKAGGGVTRLLSARELGGATVSGLAADARDVYFTSTDGAVRSVSRDGGQTTTIARGELLPSGIAADAGHVYWASRGADGANDGAIRAYDKETGAISTIAAAQPSPIALAIDGQRVYFSTLPRGERNGTVRSAPKAGGDATVLVSGEGVVRTIAVHDGGVYYLSERDRPLAPRASALVRVPAIGGEARVLDADVAFGWPLSATSRGVVYSSYDDRANRAEIRWAHAGGTEVLASRAYARDENTLGPVGLVADDDLAYFADHAWTYAGSSVGTLFAAPLVVMR